MKYAKQWVIQIRYKICANKPKSEDPRHNLITTETPHLHGNRKCSAKIS